VLQRQAVAKIEDLQQNGINLELMHMSPSDRPFDVQAFYKVLYVMFSVSMCLSVTFYIVIDYL